MCSNQLSYVAKTMFSVPLIALQSVGNGAHYEELRYNRQQFFLINQDKQIVRFLFKQRGVFVIEKC